MGFVLGPGLGRVDAGSQVWRACVTAGGLLFLLLSSHMIWASYPLSSSATTHLCLPHPCSSQICLGAIPTIPACFSPQYLCTGCACCLKHFLQMAIWGTPSLVHQRALPTEQGGQRSSPIAAHVQQSDPRWALHFPMPSRTYRRG